MGVESQQRATNTQGYHLCSGSHVLLDLGAQTAPGFPRRQLLKTIFLASCEELSLEILNSSQRLCLSKSGTKSPDAGQL